MPSAFAPARACDPDRFRPESEQFAGGWKEFPLPWEGDPEERLLEQMRDWGDPFKHGITANQSTIDTFVSYVQEQGTVKGTYSYEQIFAKLRHAR